MIEHLPWLLKLGDWLFGWLKGRPGKPFVTIRVFWKKHERPGLLILTIGIRTDVPISGVNGSYQMSSSLKPSGYWQPQTNFSRVAIYPGYEEEQEIMLFKISAADFVKKKEFDADVIIALEYQDKNSNKKYTKNCRAILKRGSDEFEMSNH
jgi:hypothetical protein